MIGWERRVLLRHYLEQGMTKTELAERFGISRQTIYRWIRSGELDRDLSAAGVHYSAPGDQRRGGPSQVGAVGGRHVRPLRGKAPIATATDMNGDRRACGISTAWAVMRTSTSRRASE